MKLFLLALITCMSFFAKADGTTVEIKSRKTFKSDFGYEFKYPDCWEVLIDSPSGELPLSRNKDIAVNETSKCRNERLKMDPNKPNGVGISVIERSYESKNQTIELFEKIKLAAAGRAAAKPSMPTKFFKIAEHNAVAYVEDHKTFIRWRVIYNCPKAEISLSGPSVRSPQKVILINLKLVISHCLNQKKPLSSQHVA